MFMKTSVVSSSHLLETAILKKRMRFIIELWEMLFLYCVQLVRIVSL